MTSARVKTAILEKRKRPDGPALHLRRRLSRGAARPRSLEVFSALARRGGWSVDKAIERPFSHNFRLKKTDRDGLKIAALDPSRLPQ